MHAQAGTIGYNAILDEEDRQKAKQASRTRTFGVSTPSTAASPPVPHDAEAHREVERLNAASYLHFLEVLKPITDDNGTPVSRLIDSLTHEARQTEQSADWHRACNRPCEAQFRDGQANTLRDVIQRLGAL